MIIGWTGFRLYSGKLIIQAGASQNEYRNARKVYQKRLLNYLRRFILQAQVVRTLRLNQSHY